MVIDESVEVSLYYARCRRSIPRLAYKYPESDGCHERHERETKYIKFLGVRYI